MANQVRNLLGSSAIDIKVTPFGVDIEKFSPKIKSISKDKIYIGNIKTLEPKYGIVDLIYSIRILKDNLNKKGFREISDNIIVKIYGDGRQKDEIVELINKLDLTNTVELKGKIPNSEVPMALENMDIFCVTSILDSESFGVSAVEAMAMEIPIVATDVDGFKEVIEDGNTGIIIERKNHSEIAKAIEKLVHDKNLRIKMGKRGRERVVRLYDWDKNVETMIELYQSCVGKSTPMIMR
jgi:glycosyltransferase involved in cell wall biosynthesis